MQEHGDDTPVACRETLGLGERRACVVSVLQVLGKVIALAAEARQVHDPLHALVEACLAERACGPDVGLVVAAVDSVAVVLNRSEGARSTDADRNGLLQWLDGFQKPPRRLFLVHGEEPTAASSL